MTHQGDFPAFVGGKSYVPDYYKLEVKSLGGVTFVTDVMEIIQALDCGAIHGMAIKYLLRAGRKEGSSAEHDYTKAMECLARLLDTPTKPKFGIDAFAPNTEWRMVEGIGVPTPPDLFTKDLTTDIPKGGNYPSCWFCRTEQVTKTRDYCAGCHEYVCTECELDSPVGTHHPSDHQPGDSSHWPAVRFPKWR